MVFTPKELKMADTTLEDKLEEKYGLIMDRAEAMEVLKISLSTIKRWEQQEIIIPIPQQARKVRFSIETVAKVLRGEIL